MAKRLHAMGQPNYANGFKLTLHPNALEIPLHWKKPQVIFVNSMSDLFHKDVPVDFIQWQAWALADGKGTSAKTGDSGHIYTYRIDHLRRTHAKTKFLSLEPLLGPLPKLNLKGINWVIVGGESGPGARPLLEDWVVDLRDQCKAKHVPFFFKQWGGVQKKRAGRLLQGETWDQMPALPSFAPA